MSDYRIAVFCGGPFAYPSLMKLSMEKFLCGLVIATNNQQVAANLGEESAKNNFPFLHLESKSDMPALEAWLDEVKPDAVFSICFPFKIPGSALKKIPHRFFNFHPGPLPAYRGPSPIFEVLKRGEKESAIAIHFMTESYDSGNLVITEKVPVAAGENYQTLTYKLSTRCGIAAMNLAEMLRFGSGKFEGTVQDESKAAFYPFPSDDDMEINWSAMTAENILSLVSACHSWSRGAITWLGEEKLRIASAELQPQIHGGDENPGTVITLNDNGSCVVVCRDKQLIKIPEFGSDFGAPGIDYLRSIGLAVNVQLGGLKP